MSQSFDASRSLTALEQDNTVIAVIEMSKAKWLIAALVPGLERQPLKKINADAPSLLKLLQHWRDEASQAGHTVKRIAVAYEAAGDGFWLARWLWARDIEAYAIHPASVAVSREHRRAKTDRLDTELLMRAFLGWLRGEKRDCSMAAIPTLEEEDARRPNRERQTLVGEQTRLINRWGGHLLTASRCAKVAVSKRCYDGGVHEQYYHHCNRFGQECVSAARHASRWVGGVPPKDIAGQVPPIPG